MFVSIKLKLLNLYVSRNKLRYKGFSKFNLFFVVCHRGGERERESNTILKYRYLFLKS